MDIAQRFKKERVLQDVGESNSGNVVLMGSYENTLGVYKKAIAKISQDTLDQQYIDLVKDIDTRAISKIIAWSPLDDGMLFQGYKGKSVYISEFVEGVPLDKWTGPRRSAEKVMHSILSSLHDTRRRSRQFCLRDIHPGNIMVQSDLSIR